jgi:hypothetical protein
MKICEKFRVYILILILIPILNSCSARSGKIWDPADARKVDPNADVRARQAIEEGRAPSLSGIYRGKNKGGAAVFASENAMWRATLEILDFLPLANVDYSGGLIITDWYGDDTTINESIKITVRFLTNEIRADGLIIIVHKKICNKQGICRVKKISSKLEKEIKDAILTQATKIQKGITTDYSKEYRKKFGNQSEREKYKEN